MLPRCRSPFRALPLLLLLVSACGTIPESTSTPSMTATPSSTSTPSITPTPTAIPIDFLSTLTPAYVGVGAGFLGVGKYVFPGSPQWDGKPIDDHGQRYDHGLVAHAPSRLDYQLDRKYQTFRTTILLEDSCNAGDGAVFRILVDEKEVYTSPVMYYYSDPEEIEIDVSFAQWLTLFVNQGATGDCDVAIWGDPSLVLADPNETIRPASVQNIQLVNQNGATEISENDSLKAVVTAGNVDASNLSYRWYRNNILISAGEDPNLSNTAMKTFAGVPEELTPQSGHSDHAIRGYSYRVEVSNASGEEIGSDETVIRGPVYSGERMRGISLPNSFREWVETPQALNSLDLLIRSINPNWVSIWNHHFVHDNSSTQIFERYTGEGDTTVSLEAIGDLIDHAHSRGLQVMYSPQINTETGPDRHEMIPSAQWFSAYKQFIIDQASFAEDHGVEILSVGTELNSMGSHDSEWREIVSGVRQVFSGKLTYQANTNWTPEGQSGWNWDITWWDVLDYIGANFYVMESVHARSTDPEFAELRELYRPFISKLQLLSSTYERPVLITEIGPMGVDGFTHFDPHTLEKCNDTTPVDLQEQADYTEVVMELVQMSPSIEGIFWSQWELTTESWSRESQCWARSESIMYKPMERIIRSWYGLR